MEFYMKYRLVTLFFFLALSTFAQTQLDVKNSVDWLSMEIKAQNTLNLETAHIRLPSGRVQAEEIIDAEYAPVIRNIILNVPVDSSRTLSSLVDSGEITMRDIDALSLPVSAVPAVLSRDMSFMSASYTISLSTISARLIQHTRPAPIQKPLMAASPIAYTGIIIIANESLPIYGRNTSSFVRPCLFPKIWDSDMNLIFEKNMTNTTVKTMVK
jgi:hypothetical protein